jgi:hypothetical protein
MGKVVRPTYPAGFSIGLLMLVFIIAFLLSSQIFNTPFLDLKENKTVYFGMFLAGLAVIIMILIIWEEFLFPVNVKLVDGGMEFRNHRTKLIAQLLIYISIPSIFTFIYLNYEVNHVRFFIWAIICSGAPVIEKIISGINNYQDFLRLTETEIEYKNNELEGCFNVIDIQKMVVIADERNIIKKFKLQFKNNDNLTIDLDEMELEAFYGAIQSFIKTKYTALLN